MPDPTVDAIAALKARVDALESRVRDVQNTHGATPL